MIDEILTVREVGELLKINEKTAYKLAPAGEIPRLKVGGSRRFAANRKSPAYQL
ncbi:helix-turn-helix domain-containing protein [Xanthobacter aminoxidans]|uniref:helix-turn-helix domain-containing protein n=1 Tax=Xanthobacter aminoxidans TaxID=186280 RepID=UPI002023105C|nr:helix-turn-helix domain-containing protein [Xanthobacter aminoxidans]MCL8384304.1 helix-turn-helix domain-containing protein [Xanthobacter aminoxidans]